MALVPLKTVIQNEAIEYSIKEFFNEYTQKKPQTELPYLLYVKIVKLFFKKFKVAVFSGNKISTPIGSFEMERVHLNQKKYLLKDKIRLEKEYGDRNAKVYRENEYFYKIYWNMRIFQPFREFYFKGSYDVVREIPSYHPLLDINVK